MFNGDGKRTGAYKYMTLPIWHASSGNGQKSVSIFYTINGTTAQIVAIGEHVNGSSYKLEWGRTAPPFKPGSTLSL